MTSPWFRSLVDLHGEPENDRGRPERLVAAAQAINEAPDDAFPGVRQVLLFDLGYDHQAAVVGFPIRHIHDQDCGRA